MSDPQPKPDDVSPELVKRSETPWRASPRREVEDAPLPPAKVYLGS